MPPKRQTKQTNSKSATTDLLPCAKDTCGKCDVEVVDGDSALACEKCLKYFHGVCLGVNNDVVTAMGKLPGCYWFCDECDGPQRASVDLPKETEKLSKMVTHLNTLVAKIPPLEIPKNPDLSTAKIMNVMTDDYKCQVRISGIEETPDNTASKQIIEDQVQIEEVLEKIDCSFPIKGVRRMGRYYPGRKRKVLITFQSPWEARLVIAKAIENNLFQEHKVLITPGLSKEDALREKTLLQKRYEMIQNGTDPKTLKIRKLKLYQNGNEVQIE